MGSRKTARDPLLDSKEKDEITLKQFVSVVYKDS